MSFDSQIRNRGFTLLELLGVLIIMSTLTVSMIHFFSSNTYQNQEEVTVVILKKAIQYAKLQALAKQHYLKLAPISQNWTLGIGLWESNDKTQWSLIRQWQWPKGVASIKWRGLQENALFFSPEIQHNALNGHFIISFHNRKPIKCVINRLGKVHIQKNFD